MRRITLLALVLLLAAIGCADGDPAVAPSSTTTPRRSTTALQRPTTAPVVSAVFGCGPMDGQAIVVRTNGLDLGPLTAVVVLDGVDVAGATAGLDGVSRFVVDMQRRPLDPAEQLRATVEVRNPAGRVVGRAATIAPFSPKAACG